MASARSYFKDLFGKDLYPRIHSKKAGQMEHPDLTLAFNTPKNPSVWTGEDLPKIPRHLHVAVAWCQRRAGERFPKRRRPEPQQEMQPGPRHKSSWKIMNISIYKSSNFPKGPFYRYRFINQTNSSWCLMIFGHFFWWAKNTPNRDLFPSPSIRTWNVLLLQTLQPLSPSQLLAGSTGAGDNISPETWANVGSHQFIAVLKGINNYKILKMMMKIFPNVHFTIIKHHIPKWYKWWTFHHHHFTIISLVRMPRDP